jgi:hypothetical protein
VSVSELNLKNLAELDDGLLASSFEAAVREVIFDMNDRPVDDCARKVTLELIFKPDHRGGDLDLVKLEHKVKAVIPSREGRECTLTPKRIGRDLRLLFATAGTDSRQPQLDFEGDENT